MSTISHMHQNEVMIERESDGMKFRFMTYRFEYPFNTWGRSIPASWGYELVEVDGQKTSVGADPDWSCEEDVIKEIKEVVEDFQIVSGYGWCLVRQDESQKPGMRV